MAIVDYNQFITVVLSDPSEQEKKMFPMFAATWRQTSERLLQGQRKPWKILAGYKEALLRELLPKIEIPKELKEHLDIYNTHFIGKFHFNSETFLIGINVGIEYRFLSCCTFLVSEERGLLWNHSDWDCNPKYPEPFSKFFENDKCKCSELIEMIQHFCQVASVLDRSFAVGGFQVRENPDIDFCADFIGLKFWFGNKHSIRYSMPILSNELCPEEVREAFVENPAHFVSVGKRKAENVLFGEFEKKVKVV
jgi:hypothetical protein